MIGIIPARGGSKGLPRKNIRAIAGFPLIYWTIQAAKASHHLDDFYVSTDDLEIAETARRFGAKVIMRPAELAQDETSTLAVLQHILKSIPCDSVMVLQPTSPIRNDNLIDEAIAEYRQGGFDTLASGYFCKFIEYGTHQNLRRQDIKGFFYDDGNIYIINSAVIKSGGWTGSKVGRKVLPRELNLEIDDEIDFAAVESVLLKRIRQGLQNRSLTEKLKAIRLVGLDVDGVLTDGGMYYGESGEELKKFNTRDGMGVELLRNAGIQTAMITRESSAAAERRARKLRIDHVYCGVIDKSKALAQLVSESGIRPDEMAYIGDDINDLQVLKQVCFSAAPADADERVKQAVFYITSRAGGRGAFRELCQLILEHRAVSGEATVQP